MMSPMLEAAISYASRGIYVFPCREKKPLTPNGFKDASLEATTILRWWSESPDAQIAVRCGAVNGLFSLDSDGPAGDAAIAKMNLPETFTVRTRIGHHQYWFHQPAGVTTKSDAGVLAPQLDRRGDGSYVIASLAKRALPDDVILAALRDINEKLAKPPLEDAELVKMVQYVSGKKPATTGSSVVLKCLKDVQSKEISWLWAKRFPLGKLSIVAGDPGLGKSAIMADFAARVSRGVEWPDGSKCPLGSVVILSAEDDSEDTIKPRVEAVGGDVNRVHVLEAVRLTKPNGEISVKYFSLDTDIPALEAAIFTLGDVRLIVVDPISAYLGSIDSHKNSEVRSVLHPLADLAARARASAIGITHLNKKTGPALYRIVDSIAFMATARAAWLVARDPDKPAERLLLLGKANLGPDGGGLGLSFTLTQKYGAVAVEWGGATNITPDAMLASDSESRDERAATVEATEWLTSQLEEGPQAVTAVQEQAKKDGFSWSTVRRAKDKLGIRSYKISVVGGWAWGLELPSRARAGGE